MSRTVRRKNYVPDWVTRDYVRVPGTWLWKWVRLEGKELEKALAKYHGCKHSYWRFPTKFARSDCETKHRSRSKTELAKFRKNPEHEVIIPRKELLPWD